MSTLAEIYDQVNTLRNDPFSHKTACKRPLAPLGNLTVEYDLEKAASWQAQHECVPITHHTCPNWCFMFDGKCDHASRIRFFTSPATTENEHELLVKGPKRPFRYLVNKEGHCRHLLDPDVNAMGGAIVGNLFILVLVWYHRVREAV